MAAPSSPLLLPSLPVASPPTSLQWLTALPVLLEPHRRVLEELRLSVPMLPEAGAEALSELVAPPTAALRRLHISASEEPLSAQTVSGFGEGLRSNTALQRIDVHGVDPADAQAAAQELLQCAQSAVRRSEPLEIAVNSAIVLTAFPRSEHDAALAELNSSAAPPASGSSGLPASVGGGGSSVKSTQASQQPGALAASAPAALGTQPGRMGSSQPPQAGPGAQGKSSMARQTTGGGAAEGDEV